MMINPFRNPYGSSPTSIPSDFAPDVTEGEQPFSPANAPGVRPMRNAAPGQLEQTGQALAQAGALESRVGNTIGDAVQQTMDGAQTKAAETQFLQASQSILTNPQSGYLFTRDMDAQTQWAAATKAISEARQNARATLTNPVQQNMFDQVTNDHMLALGQQMAAHRHGQVTQYAIAQSQARADSMGILARDAYLGGRQADYQKYSDAARDEVLNAAQLQGASPDSDVAQEMLRAKRTELVQGVVTGLLDSHQYNEAMQYFQHERDNIDMRAADTLGNAVKNEYDRNLTETKGDAFLAAAQKSGTVPYTYGPLATGSTINPMRITDVPGSARPNGRVHDGYDIAMPQGTQVTAPLDGKVVKVWNDTQFGGGLSMRVRQADGNTLGIAHLSAANLKEGDSVDRGQVIALSGRTGNATGNVLHVTLTNPDGQYIDYFGASKPQPDPAGNADPEVLERAIDAAKSDTSLDPYQQKEVIGYMEAEHTKQRVLQNQQYDEVKQQVANALVGNGGNYDALPASLRTQLRPTDAQAFQQDQDDVTKKATEIGLRANWIEHPEQMTVNAVKEAYAKHQLTDAGYLTALRTATSLQGGDDGSTDPQKVISVNVDNKQIENTLIQNGHADIANAKKGTIQQSQQVAIYQEIKDQIDAEQQVAGRALTREQKQNVIDSVFLEPKWLTLPGKTNADPWDLTPQLAAQATFTSSSGKTVNYQPIPVSARAYAVRSLIQRRQPITERNIYDTWVNAGMPGAGR